MTGGPSREENDGGSGNIVEVNPPTSAPLISHSDPNSMRAILPVVPSLSLIVSLAGKDISTIPEALHPHKNEPRTVDEDKSNWRATTSAAAKLFLRGVRDSADAFGPLKSVAGGLYFILENCEVWIPSDVYHPRCLRVFQQTKVNKQAIESLVPRVKALSASLCTSVSEGDFKEGERRKRLER